MTVELVKQFHDSFGHPVEIRPTMPDQKTAELRLELIAEELAELRDAFERNDLIEIADALGDLLYVVHGAALVCGIDLDAVVREIHRSNMSKLGADGKPIYRADGKVLKGPDYSPPDLSRALGFDV